MVFNKSSKMIAAQMSNGSWIEIGEVTGNAKNSSDSGDVHGVTYDHVMPVEIAHSMLRSSKVDGWIGLGKSYPTIYF